MEFFSGMLIKATSFSNTILNSYHYGLKLDEVSSNNTIYHNFFSILHKLHPSQGYDDGINNTWYNDQLKEGSRWTDWPGYGVYDIDGIAESNDYYPYDFRRPVFNSPPGDVTYTVGETDNYITWIITEWRPYNYSIYREDNLLESGPWAGQSLTINVDDLEIGVYSYKCVVFDQNNNSAFDYVRVTVNSIVPEFSNLHYLSFILMSVVLLISVVKLNKHRKRN